MRSLPQANGNGNGGDGAAVKESSRLATVLGVFGALLLILFATCVEYSADAFTSADSIQYTCSICTRL